MDKASYNLHSQILGSPKAPLRSAQPKGSQTGKSKVKKFKDAPKTELEKLDSVRSKVEKSLDAFVRARKELEEILSVEGSSEQDRSSSGYLLGLRAELKRHRELTSRVQMSSQGNVDHKHHRQGATEPGSSYDFLRSLMG